MPDEVGENPHQAFVLQTTTVGIIRCGRIRVTDAMRTAQEAGEGAAPEQMARALLRQVGRKEDGSPLTIEEAAAVPTAEIEQFAGEVLATHPHFYLERTKIAGPEGTKLLRGEYGKPFLDREEGESAIDFLARALNDRANRIGATFAASASALGKIGGLSGVTSIAGLSSLASSLSNTGAMARAALTPQIGATIKKPPRFVAAETSPLPDTLAAAIEPRRPADTALTVLDRQIKKFTDELPEANRVELVSVSAPGGLSFYVRERAAVSAEMISLKGFGPDAKPIEVVQHYTQLNIALMAVPENAEERQYGFIHLTDDF